MNAAEETITRKHSSGNTSTSNITNDNNYTEEIVVDEPDKEINYNHSKSNQNDGEFLEALFASGAPWWIILIILFIAILGYALSSNN